MAINRVNHGHSYAMCTLTYIILLSRLRRIMKKSRNNVIFMAINNNNTVIISIDLNPPAGSTDAAQRCPEC